MTPGQDPRPSLLVVGCGALGGYYAGRLAGAAAVEGLDPDAGAAAPLRAAGVAVAGRPEALHRRDVDGVIVAVKCYDLKAAVLSAAAVVRTRRVLFLQNGAPDIEALGRCFRGAGLCRGVSTAAVRRHKDRIQVFFPGCIYLGSLRTGAGEGRWFRGLLLRAGLAARGVADPASAVMAKLIFSAVMNPLPLWTGQGYDVLSRDGGVWALVRRAVNEGKAVSGALGVRLAFDPMALIGRVRTGDLKGIRHRGSAAGDAAAGRRTEIDDINGALARMARRAGVATPALDRIRELVGETC